MFGTAGNDTINESAHTGNYRIYGFLGQDTLTGAQGDNLLVGDGHCPKGGPPGQTVQTIPAPAWDPENSSDKYCDDDWIVGDGGDTLKGGAGDNALIGGGGPNKITGGGGRNYIQDGPLSDTIYGGQNGDIINATNGPSTIYPGKGTNVIDTVGPGISKVYCSGNNDIVYANTNDVITNCAHVYYQSNSKNRSSATHTSARHKKHKQHKKHHQGAHRLTRA